MSKKVISLLQWNKWNAKGILSSEKKILNIGNNKKYMKMKENIVKRYLEIQIKEIFIKSDVINKITISYLCFGGGCQSSKQIRPIERNKKKRK